ncbi:MAG: 3-phosphoshikimate 1-carboxyvinyltransferase [Bacteroidales bacterium]|nr:3-phosphoshikimate 1-carboxyvinyltransferase [Bacteroidales bacterium]
MQVIVSPSYLKGKVRIPSSKSYMQRVLVASLLAEGTSTIKNPGKSEDELNMLRVIELLGVQSEEQDTGLSIRGGFNPSVPWLNIGESGLGIRLIIPVIALSNKGITIEGQGSLKKRPMDTIEQVLSEAGVECKTSGGFLPVRVKGPLKGGNIKLDGSVSSQFLSGLLFALPLAENDSRVEVKHLKSKPYVDMTLEVLQKFGIQVLNHNYEIFEISGNQQYRSTEIEIEGDWSNAAFFFTGAAIRGNLQISGLNPDSMQGDKKILEVIKACGVKVGWEKGSYTLHNPDELEPFEFDATDTPDLFPPLGVLAANCKGTSRIKGVHRLRYKESNRAEAIMQELSNMDIESSVEDDDMMHIKGNKPRGGAFDSHNDHRMAMAGAMIALASENPVEISNAQAVGKSFPTFFDTLRKLNVEIITDQK